MVGRAIKLMVRLVLFLLALVAAIFWLLFFSDRPDNQIDPLTLAGDGSTLNYCELPSTRWQRQIDSRHPEGQHAWMFLRALSATCFA